MLLFLAAVSCQYFISSVADEHGKRMQAEQLARIKETSMTYLDVTLRP